MTSTFVMDQMDYRRLAGPAFSCPFSRSAPAPSAAATSSSSTGARLGAAEATRLVDICLDAGLNMFDSADVYSDGQAEEILGKAIAGRRDRVLISTKATFRHGAGPNDVGSSRFHLMRAIDASLRRLGTDYIDLFQLHGFDALTPVEEVLGTLDDLVRAGKIRYIGASNFSGWHLMKSLAVSDRYGLARYVAHQAYYSLIGREYEWELMPLGLDQKVGAVVWSPLGWARLTGKIRRGQPRPDVSRLQDKRNVDNGPQVADEYLYCGRRRARRARGGDRKDHPTDGAELAAAAADGRRRSSSARATKSSCARTSDRLGGT